jgi:hypothetical protein
LAGTDSLKNENTLLSTYIVISFSTKKKREHSFPSASMQAFQAFLCSHAKASTANQPKSSVDPAEGNMQFGMHHNSQETT